MPTERERTRLIEFPLEIFQKFGRVKDVQIVFDKKTNKSRGFGFVYFDEIESATRAKEALNATEVDSHRLRIDYSVTKRAHTPSKTFRLCEESD